MEALMNNIYIKSPAFIQNLLVSIKGFQLKKKRFNENFYLLLNKYINSDHLTRQELDALQQRKLKEVLKSANQYSELFEGLFSSSNIKIDAINLKEELKKMPIISKKEIRKQTLLYSKKKISEFTSVSTSGSTGAGLKFLQSETAINDQWAVWWRYRMWHGLSEKTWCGLFSGKHVVGNNESKSYWRINHPGKQILFSSYHISESTALLYVKKIKDSKLKWLHGYPSVISQLANIIISKKLDVGKNLELITIGSESLLPHQKKAMELAFGVPVRQHYGLAEGVANISECEHGKLHIDEDFSYVELIPTDIPDTYRLIGTNLSNFAFPFIRYDTNDIVSGLSIGCECGRHSRIVESIDGRVEDYLYLPNGTKIGRVPGIFIKYNQINEAQIEQCKKNLINVNIVKNYLYTKETELSLEKDLQRLLTHNMEIKFVYLDSIPKTKNGKLRFVVSHIK